MTSRDAALGRFRRLDLTVQRRLDGLLHGDHQGFRLAPGDDPEELVRYQPGHDVRRIDQHVTARAREPYVWLTRAQHPLDSWVLLDRSASMAFGTAADEKGDLAQSLSAAVGLLTDAPGNRFGIVELTTDGLRWRRPTPPRVGAQLALRTPASPRSGSAPVGLAEALRQLSVRHRRPGLRIVVSDLVDPDGRTERPFDWEAPLRGLAARHEVIMIEIVDPRELQLPEVGLLVLVDPESGRQREVDSSDRRVRHSYARAAAAHRQATAAAVAGAGVDHLLVRTDGDWVADLSSFVQLRRHRPARRRRVR